MFKSKIVLILVLINSIILAEDNQKRNLQKPSIKSTKYFDINGITCAIQNNGMFANHPTIRNVDFHFDNHPLIYVAGLWMGAEVDGEIRVSAGEYFTDFVGSALDEKGKPFGKNDARFRVYKISKGDNINNNPDYANWPFDLGAPSDGKGNPLLIGDQTLWCCFTDAYPENRIVSNSKPLGAEVHLTVWGWEELENVIFLRWKIFNKSEDVWNKVYLGIFSDPDLIHASDDLAGSDSTLHLTYCYESTTRYDLPYHAVGYMVLESPILPSTGDGAITFYGAVADFVNVPVYAPRMEKNLNTPFDDISYNEETAQIIYNRLQTLDKWGEPSIDPFTNRPTNWAFSGDPVTGSGWIDNFPPRDRRMMLSTGPMDMAPDDTNSITIAFIAEQNNVRLENITDLKRDARKIRGLFHNQFVVVANAVVDVNFKLGDERDVLVQVPIESKREISEVEASFYNYENEFVQSLKLYDDGLHSDENPFDNIFGNVWHTIALDEALYLNIIITDELGEKHQFERATQNITLVDQINIDATIIADSKNYDGEANPGEHVRIVFGANNNHAFDISKLYLTATIADSFIPKKRKTFLIDSLFAGSYQQNDYSVHFYANTLAIDIPAETPDNHKITIQIKCGDEQQHVWEKNVLIPIKPYRYTTNEFQPEHVSGESNAYFVIRVIDPAALTGHSYAITVSDSINDRGDQGFNLFNRTLGITLLQDHEEPDQYAFNIPVTDGFKVIDAFLPPDYVEGIFENISGGHPDPFKHLGSNLEIGNAHESSFYNVELEFTSEIDANGIKGTATGQKVFLYTFFPDLGPIDFISSPFNIWKLVNGQRVGKLNACFHEQQDLPRNNDAWTPGEKLFIMASEYDSTGQYYFNQAINPELENLYIIDYWIRWESDSSVVDIGDKLIFESHFGANEKDMWVFVPTGIEKKTSFLPEIFTLHQNYPNPFNSATTIKFSIEKRSTVTLKIFNYMGQEVIELFDIDVQSREFSISWDGRNQNEQLVSSGLYFARLESEHKIRVVKMLLIR
jgi:hypothetical protein